jgi:hypothetical protein
MAIDTNPLVSLYQNPDGIFDDNVYHNIRNPDVSQYTIVITPKDIDYKIEGLLTNEFSMSVNAHWDASNILEVVTSNIPLLSTLYPIAVNLWGLGGAANPNNLGMSSKKIYSSSGYLELDLEFRIVDWRGEGQPIKSAFIMTSLLLPKNKANYSASQITTNLASEFFNFAGGVVGVEKKDMDSLVSKGAVLLKDTMRVVKEGAIKMLNKGMINGKEISNILEDPQFFTLASSPLPVRIDIGQYFTHGDMLIESLTIDFSKSMTKCGPLYADFKIHTSSRQALLLDDTKPQEQQIGLRSQNSKSRVSVK